MMTVNEMNGLYNDIQSLIEHLKKHPYAQGAQKLLLDNLVVLDKELQNGAPTPDPWTHGFKIQGTKTGRMTPTGRFIVDKPPLSY